MTVEDNRTSHKKSFINILPSVGIALVLLSVSRGTAFPKDCACAKRKQGPVVQSVVSLTSLLRVILLTVLADTIYNILIFFAEKM